MNPHPIPGGGVFLLGIPLDPNQTLTQLKITVPTYGPVLALLGLTLGRI